MTIREQLEEIHDRDLIWPSRGRIAYSTSIERDYPQIDVHLLCNVLGDNLMDWHAAKADYLETVEEEA